MSTDHLERAYLKVSVDNETARLKDQRGLENAPMGGWRNRAIESIAEREGMNPYALDRIIREDCEEAPIDVIPALTPDVLDTIRGTLFRDSELCLSKLNDPATGDAYWAGELWQIDRARRALGLED